MKLPCGEEEEKEEIRHGRQAITANSKPPTSENIIGLHSITFTNDMLKSNHVHHDYELVKVLKSLFGHEQEVLVIK